MKSFIEQVSTYAEYHRDPKNITTHLFGVPFIVFAVMVLLSRPIFEVGGYSFTVAVIGYIAVTLFYLSLNLLFGLLMAVIFAAGIYAATIVAGMSTIVWLSTGLGLFVGGWIIQFVGHHYEGKKPAFVDDLVGLLIGPLFVTAEICFALGFCKTLKEQIEQRAGPIRIS